MTKLPFMIPAMAAALAFSPAALAANSTAIDGAYLLRQSDERQRVLSIEQGGTVSQISDQQNTVGFTSGLGTWTKTGPGSARASIVDFNHPENAADGQGAAMIVYDLTFSKPVDGKYQKVTGYFTGQAYNAGQNPQSPDEPHVRSFGTRFEGTRILAE
ncbi:hypothetical protein [Hoeflea sp. TYP-13]|uniref:hypothetical protein n=1 Tax=Hoeflea sp. TYP-13 TaxID=3230023 RepID=UPI0034C6212C